MYLNITGIDLVEHNVGETTEMLINISVIDLCKQNAGDSYSLVRLSCAGISLLYHYS